MCLRCCNGVRLQPCCYVCKRNSTGDSNRPGHCGYRPAKPPQMGVSQMIKRESVSSLSAGNSPLAARDETFERQFESLHEFMTARLFDDGSERETATLLVFASDGQWKACLNDRAEGRVAFVTGRTVQDLFKLLNEQLDSSSVEWRASKQYGKKK